MAFSLVLCFISNEKIFSVDVLISAKIQPVLNSLSKNNYICVFLFSWDFMNIIVVAWIKMHLTKMNWYKNRCTDIHS